MSYRLSLDEAVPDALRGAAIGQLEAAARVLRDERDEHPVEAVHGARKNLKKTRSILRLAQPDMPKAAYRREKRFLRDTARLISGARDADVMLQTLDGLSERFVGRLPERSFRELRDRLAEEADRSQGQSRASTADDVVDALEAATARVRDWPVDRCGKNALNAGAMRAYDRGRVAYATVVRGNSSVEGLHEWRKRVKDLWYHQRLLRDAWPAVLKAHAAAAHRLADVLGDDHDLAVLAETLLAGQGPLADAPVPEVTVLGLIAERRVQLQAEALDLGQRVYAEKPKAYDRRLRTYLEIARRDVLVAGSA